MALCSARPKTSDVSETRFYKRATFVAHLPAAYRYTSSHAWLAPSPEGAGRWRIGITRFALRMLGELVEVRFDATAGQPVRVGDVVGNLEGFKAVSDLFCVVDGVFHQGNPALADGPEPLTRDVHRAWLYEAEGQPDPRALDVEGYTAVLDATIDRILEQQAADSNSIPS